MKKYIVPTTFYTVLDTESSLMVTSFNVDTETTINPGGEESDGTTGQLSREFEWGSQNWED